MKCGTTFSWEFRMAGPEIWGASSARVYQTKFDNAKQIDDEFPNQQNKYGAIPKTRRPEASSQITSHRSRPRAPYPLSRGFFFIIRRRTEANNSDSV